MEKSIITSRFSASSLTTKVFLSVACIGGYFLHIGFYEGCPWWNHLLYSFCHANLFHLCINMMVLWGIRNKIPLVEALGVAVVASFMPLYVDGATMGLSGFLFAAFGTMWGKTGRWKDAFKKAMPFIVCTMIVPNVNGSLHLWCFWVGYFVGFLRNVFHRFRVF